MMGYQDLIKLQKIKGINDKKSFIKEHLNDEYFKMALYYISTPTISYNISEKTIFEYINQIKNDDKSLLTWIKRNNINSIFDVFNKLSNLKGLDNDTIAKVAAYLNTFEDEEKKVYAKILAKTFKIGVTEKTINKVIPGLIPEWEVQQAYQLEKYPIKENTEFWLTQKLNGVRATYYKGKLIARSGVPYEGLNHIIRVLDNYPGDVVFDGELTLKNKGKLSDNEAFRTSTGILNSDAESKPEIKYTIFDMIKTSDFENGRDGENYSSRRKTLDKSSNYLNSKMGEVEVLPVLYHGTDQTQIEKLLDKMVKEDKEGLMLNLDCPYKRSRHRGILKIKRFYTMDLEIVGYEEGSGKLAETLGALIVKYKNNEVKVGTGFSDDQRSEFWSKKEDLIGKICEVKYKEVSSDKNTGLESLQFPVFIQIRKDKNTVSYD